MRKPANLLRAGLALIVVAWAASVAAQERPLNRIADGDFESGFVSLRLPPGAPLPMFWGGWASRGQRAPLMLEGNSFDGDRSLRVVATVSDPVQVMQDLPLNARGYGMRLAFLIEEGVQTVRLLRRDEAGAVDAALPAFEATISPEAMRFTTPDGTWQIDLPVARGTWHLLSVVADPRTGAQSVQLDGTPLIALPGVAPGSASTLVVGADGARRGVFRYDAVEVVSLIDLELTTLREALARLDEPLPDALLDRLAAAAAALERGSQLLALPELAVARDLLRRSSPDAGDLERRLDDLIDLAEADREKRQAAALLESSSLFESSGLFE